MKTVFLHGLGQTAQDWKEVVQQLSISDVDCPELFSSTEDEISYSQILGDLEQRYSEAPVFFPIHTPASVQRNIGTIMLIPNWKTMISAFITSFLLSLFIYKLLYHFYCFCLHFYV